MTKEEQAREYSGCPDAPHICEECEYNIVDGIPCVKRQMYDSFIAGFEAAEQDTKIIRVFEVNIKSK